MPLESRFVDCPRCICAANGFNADAAPSQQVIKRIVRTSRCCHYDAICVDPAHARRFVDVGDIRCRAVDIFDDVMGDYLDLGLMHPRRIRYVIDVGLLLEIDGLVLHHRSRNLLPRMTSS